MPVELGAGVETDAMLEAFTVEAVLPPVETFDVVGGFDVVGIFDVVVDLCELVVLCDEVVFFVVAAARFSFWGKERTPSKVKRPKVNIASAFIRETQEQEDSSELLNDRQHSRWAF